MLLLWVFNNVMASILTALCLLQLDYAKRPEFTQMYESELMGSGYLAIGYVIGAIVRECAVIFSQAATGRWISTLDSAIYSMITLIVDFYAIGTILLACAQAYES